jgi:SAM-dependent methyltransferase
MDRTIPSPVTGAPAIPCDGVETQAVIERYRYDWGLEVANRLGGRRRLDIYRCSDTGYRFFHPRELAGEADFYDEFWALENPTVHRPEGAWRDDWQFALEQLKPEDRVLDVGCAEGAFIARAGEVAQLEGIDENAEGCHIARARGLKVSCTSVRDFADSHRGAYDKVVASQVLEHVYDVAGFIGSLKDLLRPGGEMILSVPNNQPYYAGWAKYEPLNNPPHHIGLWNEESLRKMAGHFGLEVERVAYLGAPDRLALQIYRRAAHLAGISRGPRQLTRGDWIKLVLAAPLGTLLTLVRRLRGASFAYGYISVVLRRPEE